MIARLHALYLSAYRAARALRAAVARPDHFDVFGEDDLIV